MKLYKLTLLALFGLIAFTRAQDDDEAEIEIEDDEDIADVTGEEAPAEEVPPQLMPTPMPGVRAFAFFPDGPASVTGGKMSEIVIGMQNNGEKDIEMMSVSGKLMMPGATGQQEVVQNFTNVGYDKQEVSSHKEASFSYAFMPALQTGGREFHMTLELYYREKDTNEFYRAVPFDEPIQILESQEGVMTEVIQMYFTLFALAIAGGFVAYNKFLAKKLAALADNKVERGNVGADMSWIPSGHAKKSQ